MPRRGLVPRRVVLASASPRRRDLLEAAGFEVIVRPSGVEELSEGLAPRALVIANAEMKALELAATTFGDVVIGADTVVVLDGRILGKPRDLEDATRMLRLLAGRTHEVLTGVSMMLRGETVVRCSFVESTLVAFRPFDEFMIADYLKDINPLDKAGSYAAQDDRGRLIERIEGSMDNVIGLPIARVIKALELHFAESEAG